MLYDDITCSIDGGIATITLNRPTRRNAYTPDMGVELAHAFRSAFADEAVRVVILAGAGAGFCAGAEREFLAGKVGRHGLALGEEEWITHFSLEICASAKPLIAAVHGAAVGIGVTMILPFDLRIAADDAVFGFPFTRLGIVPGLGSSHLLPQLVGRAKAAELVLCSSSLNAQEALAMGLVNHVVPGDQLLTAARALADRILASPPEPIAAAKRALAYGAGATLDAAIANEHRENAVLRTLREHIAVQSLTAAGTTPLKPTKSS